jgi:hypothetical protein
MRAADRDRCSRRRTASESATDITKLVLVVLADDSTWVPGSASSTGELGCLSCWSVRGCLGNLASSKHSSMDAAVEPRWPVTPIERVKRLTPEGEGFNHNHEHDVLSTLANVSVLC